MLLRDDLLNPIAGEKACGQDLRYSPLYDKLKEARREEEDVSQGDWEHEIKKADYPLVSKLCQETLASKTKDLQLAAWLTEALLRTEGFSGLQQGLDLLRRLIEAFWEGLYPELEDGDAELRAAPLDWIGSRFGDFARNVPLNKAGHDFFQYRESRTVGYEADASGDEQEQARAASIRDGKITAEEFDKALADTPKDFYKGRLQSVQDCLAALEALREVCETKFPAEARPSFSRLNDALEEVRAVLRGLLQKRLEQDPDTDGTPALEGEVGEAAPALAVGGGAAAAPVRVAAARVTALATRDDAFRAVVASAGFLRLENPDDPVPYLLLRALRWGELRALGDSPDPAMLEAPSTELRKRLRMLAADGNFEELLQVAEQAMSTAVGRAWLDLQRHTVHGCEELGYGLAAAAVRAELAALLRDYRDLADSSLNDETPTASAETKAWLQEFTLSRAAGPARVEEASAPAPGIPELREEEEVAEKPPGASPDALELAQQAVAEGRPREAIEILMREAAQERTGRARFRRRLQLAEICLAAGYEHVGAPILSALADEIEARKLDEWESAEFIAHALVLFMRCLEKTGVAPEKKQRLYDRICRLDAVQALRISG